MSSSYGSITFYCPCGTTFGHVVGSVRGIRISCTKCSASGMVQRLSDRVFKGVRDGGIALKPKEWLLDLSDWEFWQRKGLRAACECGGEMTTMSPDRCPNCNEIGDMGTCKLFIIYPWPTYWRRRGG